MLEKIDGENSQADESACLTLTESCCWSYLRTGFTVCEGQDRIELWKSRGCWFTSAAHRMRFL